MDILRNNSNAALPEDFTDKVMAAIEDRVQIRRRRNITAISCIAGFFVAGVTFTLLMVLNIFDLQSHLRLFFTDVFHFVQGIILPISSVMSHSFMEVVHVLNLIDIFHLGTNAEFSGGLVLSLPFVIITNFIVLMVLYFIVEKRTNRRKSVLK